MQYYGSASQTNIIAFDQLIPDAHAIDMQTYANPYSGTGGVTWIPRQLGPVSDEARSHLLAHADEYSAGDNPSPYVLLPNKERINIGQSASRDGRTTSPPYSFAIHRLWRAQHRPRPAGWRTWGSPRSG